MANHRNPVVNMQPNSVGQQMFSQHVSFMLCGIFFIVVRKRKVDLITKGKF